MRIDERTKIADLLKHHPDALETIVTLSPDFKKLRNPILRALMAKRTTIAMASKVGGCTPSDFFRVLEPLGFEVDLESRTIQFDDVPPEIPKPSYLQEIGPADLQEFDVREILAGGIDPLKAIQQKVKALKVGEVLVIINSFEPVPLIKLLEKQGFQSYVEFIDQDTIKTYFYKVDNHPLTEEKDEIQPVLTGDWQELLTRFSDNLVEIDVRHLEMPMPMMTILEQLEKLPQEKALYVQHKRIPVFLLNELQDRGFEYRINEVGDGEVYLLIFK